MVGLVDCSGLCLHKIWNNLGLGPPSRAKRWKAFILSSRDCKLKARQWAKTIKTGRAFREGGEAFAFALPDWCYRRAALWMAKTNSVGKMEEEEKTDALKVSIRGFLFTIAYCSVPYYSQWCPQEMNQWSRSYPAGSRIWGCEDLRRHDAWTEHCGCRRETSGLSLKQ